MSLERAWRPPKEPWQPCQSNKDVYSKLCIPKRTNEERPEMKGRYFLMKAEKREDILRENDLL